MLELISNTYAKRNDSIYVGQLIRAQEKSRTYTDVAVSQNVYGGVYANTYQSTEETFVAWIKDISTGNETAVHGTGQMVALPGHYVGIAESNGHTIAKVNFDSNQSYTTINRKQNIFGSVILGLMAPLLGFFMFPFLMIFTFLTHKIVRPTFTQFLTSHMLRVNFLFTVLGTIYYLVVPYLYLNSIESFDSITAGIVWSYIGGSVAFFLICTYVAGQQYNAQVQSAINDMQAIYNRAKQVE